MKIKTRIKIIEMNSGEMVYIPQVWEVDLIKHILVALFCIVVSPFLLFYSICAWKWPFESFYGDIKKVEDKYIADEYEVQLKSLLEAQEVIDGFIAQHEADKIKEKEQEALLHLSKKKRTTYLKYP